LIDSGDFLTAADELMSLRMEHEDLCPNADRTKKLATGLLRAEAWDQAEIWLQEFIDRYPDDCAWARISMAQLVLTQFRRPRAAIEYLRAIKAEELNDAQKQRVRRIAGVAREQIRHGVEDEEPQW
jgi:TolA-binding protein